VWGKAAVEHCFCVAWLCTPIDLLGVHIKHHDLQGQQQEMMHRLAFLILNSDQADQGTIKAAWVDAEMQGASGTVQLVHNCQ
jgi:hypothetical protein